MPPAGSGLLPVMGDPGLPVLGHSIIAVSDGLKLARRGYERFGAVSWANVFTMKAAFVVGPEAMEEVLTNREKAFSSHDGWEMLIGPFFEGGVMLMDFDEHLHHRRIMQQAFRHERLVSYLDLLNPAVSRGLDGWRAGRAFPVYPALKQLTLDIATQVFMGGELDADAEQVNSDFIDLVRGGQTAIRAEVRGGRWHRGMRSRRRMEEFFLRQIPAKRASGEDDLFSVLCRAESEDGVRFSDREVVNHMIFTMMAAHDTSTITAAMMCFFLAKHPEWQQRVRDESLALGKPEISFDDLEALSSMDLVFREVLRMNPPVSIVARRAIKDTEICGHYIPTGTPIHVGIYASHRIEAFWHDPDVFDPERFAPERAEDKAHKYAWAPFGGGAHKCIGMHFGGMEVKSILHQLLLRYELHVAADYEPYMDTATGPYPADGLPVDLLPR